MPTPCHIIVEGNPVIIYASRNGSPDKVLPKLKTFLEKFWQERDTFGENLDTPGCLAAQILIRFGYEICEDDFSNLRIGLNYDPQVEYIYLVSLDHQGTVTVWKPETAYHQQPSLGLKGCQRVLEENNK
jgi:hypothetical protein